MSIERPFELQVADLWGAVLNLSLPAESQLSILEELGSREAIDELALAFDDRFWVAEEAYNRNLLSRTELTLLADRRSTHDDTSRHITDSISRRGRTVPPAAARCALLCSASFRGRHATVD